MGYDVTFEGEISIDPPLSWKMIKGSPFLPDLARKSGRCVQLFLVEEEEDGDEGTFTRRSATAIVPVTTGSMSASRILDEVQKIVDLGKKHAFTGYLDANGEDRGDLWRLAVVDGKAVKIYPRIVWPDGSEEPARD